MNEIYILLPILAFLTSVLSGIIGMAGGITLLSLMTFFLPIKDIIPIHGMVQLTSNFSRGLFLRAHIKKRPLFLMFCGAPFGAILAFTIIKELGNSKYYYIPVAAIIFYTIFKPKKLPEIKLKTFGFFTLGLISALASALFGATGPLLAPFFLRDDWTKEEIVATKACAQSMTHLLKIPLFIAISFDYSQYFIIIVTMACASVVGTKVGVALLAKSTQRFFILIYKSALLIAGLRILYKVFLV